jgi:uncharacterized membrane protein YphA (DoxX/SURF4 family)
MRSSLLALVALAFLRTVVGLHFFLEGVSHLRDPNWSSAGFRKAAVGPLADRYQALLTETGNWSESIGAADGRPVDEAVAAWATSVESAWQKRLDERLRIAPLSGEQSAAAKQAIKTARGELDAWLKSLRSDLIAYRLEVQRLADTEARRASHEIPFERERVAKKRRELGGKAAGWMNDAAAIGRVLEASWDAELAPALRSRVATAAPHTAMWKADRFVSWALVTIGGCLVLGLFTKFNAMGAACFLLTVVAAQPFWMAEAQPTYNQWVELAALLVIASLPTGGWSGLDYFLQPWLRSCCPLSCLCAAKPATGTP